MDVPLEHLGLFRPRTSEDRHVPSVEEIEDPDVPAALPCTKLVDGVPEEVGLRPAEFMADLRQPLDAHEALRMGARVPPVQVEEPFADGHPTAIVLEEPDLRSRHPMLPGRYNIIVISSRGPVS